MEDIIKILTFKNKTISTMESCTGGSLANYITNIEGSSNVFKFGAVTYSNEYKIKMGVPKTIIDKYTVYSEETAIAMAKAITKYTKSNYGIGITGKLMKSDNYNPGDINNIVYVSIYDKDNKNSITFSMTVSKDNRIDNKKLVIDEIINKLHDIIK